MKEERFVLVVQVGETLACPPTEGLAKAEVLEVLQLLKAKLGLKLRPWQKVNEHFRLMAGPEAEGWCICMWRVYMPVEEKAKAKQAKRRQSQPVAPAAQA